MANHIDRGELALSAFSLEYPLEKKDLGSDALLSKRGMEFQTEAWRVGDIGSLCIMRMRAFLGLMRMETAVFSPTGIDAPLFNIDWVGAFGAETQIAELYDVQLQPWPDACQAQFQLVRDSVADVPDMQRDAKWYDAILYPCSCAKRGRKVAPQLYGMAQDYITHYVAQLSELPACDAAQKAEKVRAFAEHLYAEGGVAVQQVTKLFGSETARRLIVHHLYGVEDA